MRLTIALALLLSCSGCAELFALADLALGINQQHMNQQMINSAVNYNKAAANYLRRH